MSVDQSMSSWGGVAGIIIARIIIAVVIG